VMRTGCWMTSGRRRRRTAIGKGVRVILDAQAVPKGDQQGGWRYTPKSTDADLSVTGWQLMALRGASNVGANIPEKALQDGIDYVSKRAVFGGGFAYQGSGGVDAALTGTGVLALALLGHADAPEVKSGGTYLLTNDITKSARFYYYTVYYCSQAAWQLGGNLLDGDQSRHLGGAAQQTKGRRVVDGRGEQRRVLHVDGEFLALTVPYRYLPIYQR